MATRRTRDYYQALGYPAYRWALFAKVPFTSLAVPSAPGAAGVRVWYAEQSLEPFDLVSELLLDQMRRMLKP